MLTAWLSAAAYAVVGSVWSLTARPRASLLSGLHQFGSIVAQGTMQLAVSFLLSAALYTALYMALVPDESREHAVHFATCAPSDGAPSPPERLAELTFAPPSAPAFSPERRRALAPLAGGWGYAATLCMTMPESPVNRDAGTFMVGLRMLDERNRTLAADSRPLVLRYRSAPLRWLAVAAYAVPLLLGWSEEAQTHCFELSSYFFLPPREPVSRALLTLSSCSVQVHAARPPAAASCPPCARHVTPTQPPHGRA